MADLHTVIGKVVLKNPVICGSGEHTMDETGIRAAISSGAGAVVATAVSSTARSRVSTVGADDAPQAETSKAPMRRNGAMKQRRICS